VTSDEGDRVQPGQVVRNRWSRCVVEVSRCYVLRALAWVGAFPPGVLAVLMARSVEIALPMVVSLTVCV
jgi:hypothetical protein